MKKVSIKKLFINANPGSILIGRQREFCRSWNNQSEVTVNGIHFIQEDSPLEIAAAIKNWNYEMWGVLTSYFLKVPFSRINSSQNR